MRRRVVATLMVTVLAGSAVAGCGSDDAPKAKPAPLKRCELAGTGFEFRTRLASCQKAIDKGVDLSVDAGYESDPDAVGAGAAFAALCDIIQGKEKVVYDDEAGRDLAKALHRTGVCPGKMSNLDPTP